MKLSREEQAKLLSKWLTSGLTKTEFCKQHNIYVSSLNRWIKKNSQENKQTTNFIKLKASVVPQQACNYCEVHFPSGVKLIFNQAPEITLLKQII
jgi:predicted transcriptional regulator